MATIEQSRTALEDLAGRLSKMDEATRASNLADRSLSCTITDLGVTFVTMLGRDGAGPVTEVGPQDARANVRFTTSSDELLTIAEDPKRFARAWLTGKVKVEATLPDLLRLRKLL